MRDLSTVEGTYTETWVSNTEWRRETVVGASRRVEVGGATGRWLLSSGPPLPIEIQRFSSLLELSPPWWQEFTFQPTTDHDVNGTAIRCVVTLTEETGERYALCFYKESGLLMQTTMPSGENEGCRSSYGVCRKGTESWKQRLLSFPSTLSLIRRHSYSLRAPSK
jgi:hypothetical protein